VGFRVLPWSGCRDNTVIMDSAREGEKYSGRWDKVSQSERKHVLYTLMQVCFRDNGWVSFEHGIGSQRGGSAFSTP